VGRPDTLIPLHSILFGPNIPAGMDWATLGSLTYLLRKTSEAVSPPIQVTAEHDYFRVHDGRHRVIASIISGRTHINADIQGVNR